MRSALVGILALVALPACSGTGTDPQWARLPTSGINGDSTIAGSPAPIPRFSAPPALDGKLDDPAWRSAAVLGPFVDPGEGQAVPASHPVAAFARAGYDEQNLYLGFVVRDGAPVAPFPPTQPTQIDPHVWGKSSAVELMLQPGDPGDNRDYYELQIDTGGAVFDSHFDDYNAPINGAGETRTFGHQEWSSHAQHRAYVAKGRFYAIEAAIPWSALAPGRSAIPPRAGDVWRLDLYSFRDGQRQALAWSPLRRQGNFHKAARFGRIVFQ